MRSLIQVILALLLCWSANGCMSAGVPQSQILSTPTLDEILRAPRQIASETDYVLVDLSEDSSCGSVAWQSTTKSGALFGHASFCLPEASSWYPCCPIPIPDFATRGCQLCDSLVFIRIELQKTHSDSVALVEQNLPLIRVQFTAPSKGIVIATASGDLNKGSESTDTSRIEIGISVDREIPVDLMRKEWNLPPDNTKSKNRRFIWMQKQFPVEDGVTVISLYGRNLSGDSDVYIKGRTLFVTFIPDDKSNQQKGDDARQNDQKNK